MALCRSKREIAWLQQLPLESEILPYPNLDERTSSAAMDNDGLARNRRQSGVDLNRCGRTIKL